MTLQNDRQLIISTAGSRKATLWPSQSMYWADVCYKLFSPLRGIETLAEYLRLPKSKQDDLKDVGGFVGGTLKDNRRKATNVIGRDVITLDLDNIPGGETQTVLLRVESLGCGYAVYSTRKHEPVRPRLRILVPLDRTCTADEYKPLARKLASFIGIELCDPSTFEPHRLMYWPSCCSDSEYIYQVGDKPFVSVDGLLSTYTDWRNVAEWPQVPGAQQEHTKLATKQGDPLSKTGVVGAFCRTYDIYRAIETFIPDTYTTCDNAEDRLTFVGGSTVGGAIIYESGNFLYSHHATDPAGGKLCNSFDLVRLHKFGKLDDDAKPDTPVNKLPSYSAMTEFAVSDSQVAFILNQERYEKATAEFGSGLSEADNNWFSKLDINKTTGAIAKSSYNIGVLLGHDPNLKNRIKHNIFSDKIIGFPPLPWGDRENSTNVFEWKGSDDSGLNIYIERTLGIRHRDMVKDAFIIHVAKNSFDPVKDYVSSLQWDGTKRLDTLLSDYLGAKDTSYTRAVIRKSLVAAIARVMTPGCKFDCMLVLTGPQGIGKTTFLRKLGKGWHTESLTSFDGKDALELIQGNWLIEVGELSAYSKADIKAVKLFLSRCEDEYRKPYARMPEKHLRRCVFFGTTNDSEFLRDSTGNRRFWPVKCSMNSAKSVFNELDKEVDQIWAEAYCYWQLGEKLYLENEVESEARKQQSLYFESDPLQGQIEEFLKRPVHEEWIDYGLNQRELFWSGINQVNYKIIARDRVCALEVWKECLKETRTMAKKDASRINQIIEVIPGWMRSQPIKFGPDYGKQRGWIFEAATNP